MPYRVSTGPETDIVYTCGVGVGIAVGCGVAVGCAVGCAVGSAVGVADADAETEGDTPPAALGDAWLVLSDDKQPVIDNEATVTSTITANNFFSIHVSPLDEKMNRTRKVVA
jgi:hypothetical protein